MDLDAPSPRGQLRGWTTPLYGVVAHEPGPSDPNIDSPDASIGWPEVLWGRAIRKAFLTDIAQ